MFRKAHELLAFLLLMKSLCCWHPCWRKQRCLASLMFLSVLLLKMFLLLYIPGVPVDECFPAVASLPTVVGVPAVSGVLAVACLQLLLFLRSRKSDMLHYRHNNYRTDKMFCNRTIGIIDHRINVSIYLSDSYPAFFLLIATTSNKNF